MTKKSKKTNVPMQPGPMTTKDMAKMDAEYKAERHMTDAMKKHPRYKQAHKRLTKELLGENKRTARLADNSVAGMFHNGMMKATEHTEPDGD